mmetsp:Transcript_42034/g.119338  ORF Transcript_42034/g.119338 Transcript_42034/m.119338 type:complete len:88 (-) Transcript_42034:56-319(-)
MRSDVTGDGPSWASKPLHVRRAGRVEARRGGRVRGGWTDSRGARVWSEGEMAMYVWGSSSLCLNGWTLVHACLQRMRDPDQSIHLPA